MKKFSIDSLKGLFPKYYFDEEKAQRQIAAGKEAERLITGQIYIDVMKPIFRTISEEASQRVRNDMEHRDRNLGILDAIDIIENKLTEVITLGKTAEANLIKYKTKKKK